jgi:NTP pyrophosphatase (non-canonical NTP hydrolase)
MFALGDRDWPGAAKVLEEAGEVVQVFGKLLATAGRTEHWDGKGDLRDRLLDELVDLQAAIDFFVQTNGIDGEAYRARVTQKAALFQEWHDAHRTTESPHIVTATER